MKNNELRIVCACHSQEHQMLFWYDDSCTWPELYVEVSLTTHRNFFKRLLYGLRYAFGYRCRYGAWDELIIKKEDEKTLRDFLNERNKIINPIK